jgi:uncharacterized repeat protein (TIGR01451 family)
MKRRTGDIQKSTGQSLVEMALVLPVVLLLVFGVFELGRVVFIFSALNNASREAARFGAATGTAGTGTPRYLDCAAIRQHAIETAFLAGLRASEIEIAYDRPLVVTDTNGIVTGTMEVYALCDDHPNANEVIQGHRIVVTITRSIEPLVPIVPLPTFSPTFVTARTILKDIIIGPVECSDGVDNDGDTFTDWPDDPGCSGPDDTTEADCYSLSVTGQPPEGGNLGISPSANCANRYIERTFVTLSVTPEERYTFDRWEGDASGTSSPVQIQMTSDKNVVARFRLLTSALHVTKDAPPEVFAEEPFTYTISVSNPYTDTARNLIVTDTLPVGVTYISSSAGCTPPTSPDGIVVCNVPELAVGDTLPITISVRAPIAQTGSPVTLTNTVTATAFEYDPDPSDNIDTAVTTVVPMANLWVSEKNASNTEVEAGEVFTYSITVDNWGPSTATNVTVTDVLPSQVRFVGSGAGSNCTADSTAPGATVTCLLGEMARDETRTVSFTVVANGGPDNLAENQATATATEYDPSPANNDSSNDDGSEETTIISADVYLDKRPNSGTARRDQVFSYYLDVGNNGPSTALDVRVRDQLPEGVDYVGNNINPSLAGASCHPPDADRIVVCELGDLPAGIPQRTIRIDVVPITPETGSVTLQNVAEIESSTFDYDTSNNSETVSTTANAVVNLSISKSGPQLIQHGQTLTYTIAVANGANFSTAYNVRVLDTLPTTGAFEYIGKVNDPDNDWSCDPPALGTVLCQRDEPLLAGQSDSLVIVIRPEEPGTYTNSARVTSTENAAGVSDSHETTVEPVVGLTANKSASGTPFSEGDSFTYTVTVGNAGPSNATNAKLIDTLPTGITLLSVARPSTWSCDLGKLPELSCTPDNGVLSAGGGVIFTFTVRADSTGIKTNTATLLTSQGDASGSVTVTVNPSVDLELTASAPPTVTLGAPSTFTLQVVNNGPGTAHDVVVTDYLTLPSGSSVDVVTQPAAGWACDFLPSPSRVVCTTSELVANASVDVEVSILPGAVGTVEGDADVTSTEDQYDVPSSNNSDTHSTTVGL